METDWLGTLLNTKFFGSCDLHPNLRKNEKNKFCIDCSVSFCKNCTVHDLHRQVHIWKYVYHEVVRVQDAEKYFRCSEIHTYKVNGEISVHLNSRGQSVDAKPPKTKSGGSCEDCGRYVQYPNRFCSIACKVSVNSKLKDQSIRTIVSLSPDFGNLSFKEKTSAETNASELESTISIAESREETKASPSSSSQPRKRRRKDTPHRSPSF
ncbi:uncharacterized protein LOC111807405 [Cucurbita pepo subsp. pepo]|uniref:uncharacterized protein LOC111807405 n=1 Tax=Cucurbita pepo subsp. pepo TaxID=3664 RepID=UPI000C9D4E2E|nr:uncharacterized protein LOC111807405 [Cucurbita pepo subsp. pepo]